MSQRRGAKGSIERAVKKNMEPFPVDPELTKSYQIHERSRQDHIRMHRIVERDKSSRGGT